MFTAPGLSRDDPADEVKLLALQPGCAMRDPDELGEEDLGGYAEEFKVDPADAPPARKTYPHSARGVLIWMVEHKVRNGLLTTIAGAGCLALTMAQLEASGSAYVLIMVLGWLTTPVGLCVAILPLPEEAEAKLRGEIRPDGTYWRFWHGAVRAAFLGGLVAALFSVFVPYI